jgi:hypothetical protein
MAGSINLSLSQQFDKLNGNLLSGGRLYFYAAGTDAPQDAFKDTGLVLPHPNPIILASDGRVPQLYFADGSIHVRLTDSGGVVQFDEDNVLVIGASSGGGGGGGSSVDPNAVFQTGWINWQPSGVARDGWVRANGNTISNGLTGGGTERHNADCQQLFEYLYGAFPDSYCQVLPSRSGNALNDFNAGHTIALLDFREVLIGGLSDMGSSDRGGFSAVPIEKGGRTTPAGIIGEITHTLSTGEMPTHFHTGNTGGESTPHNHGGGSLFDAAGTAFAGTGTGTPALFVNVVNSTGSGATDNNTVDHTHPFTTDPTGSSSPVHNTTPRTILGTFFIKL